MFRLYELLQHQLPAQLTIASPVDYPTYKLYILSFGERGGESRSIPCFANMLCTTVPVGNVHHSDVRLHLPYCEQAQLHVVMPILGQYSIFRGGPHKLYCTSTSAQ